MIRVTHNSRVDRYSLELNERPHHVDFSFNEILNFLFLALPRFGLTSAQAKKEIEDAFAEMYDKADNWIEFGMHGTFVVSGKNESQWV